jgi:hypothetical protein
MPTFSGRSVQGYQSLALGVSSLAGEILIETSDRALPPYERVGYYYLSVVPGFGPPRSYVVKRGIIYSPGFLERFESSLASGMDTWRLDANWNASGIPYRVSLT